MTSTAADRRAAGEFVAAVQAAMLEAANPARAPGMQAYLKTSQAFYGIQAPERRAILRHTLSSHPIETQAAWTQAVERLWQGDRREDMYLALDLAERFPDFLNLSSWDLLSRLTHSAPHWDTLDWIAARLVGPVVDQNRHLESELTAWSKSDNLWVRRASLLAHLKHGPRTNLPLLSDTILHLRHEDEFFIQKAIGWVLRELSKSNPEWVYDFLELHGDGLAPLSRREASKHLDLSSAGHD